MLEKYQKFVQQLHGTAWYVASTIVMQSTLTAILTEAGYNFGLRSWLQRLCVKGWIKRRIKRRNSTSYQQTMSALQRWTGTGDGSSLFSLPYQQLCGQIANALRNQLEYGEGILLDIFAQDADPKDLDRLKNQNPQDLSQEKQNDLAIARDQVFYYADRGLDDLQITLAKFWIKVDYIFSVAISFILLEFLLTPPTTLSVGTDRVETIFSISVSIISGFLAPTIRNFLLNIIYKK